MMETVIYAAHWITIVLMVVAAIIGVCQSFGLFD